MPTFASYDGTRLAYTEVGDGPPLLCLPGGPGRASVYLEDLGGVSASRTLVRLDSRATGMSEVPADPASLRFDRLADDVEALRAHLGLERADVLAHSAGAVVAQVWASRHSSRVRSLVLVAAVAALQAGGGAPTSRRSVRRGQTSRGSPSCPAPATSRGSTSPTPSGRPSTPSSPRCEASPRCDADCAWGIMLGAGSPDSMEVLMAKTIPTAARHLLEGKNFAHVATLMPDGSPQTTPVWVDVDGESITFNTARGRTKYENLRRDPRVALSVPNPDNPYEYLQVRGRAELVEEGAEEHIDKLAKKYMGVDSYPMRQEGEVRVIVRIVPEAFQHFGA